MIRNALENMGLTEGECEVYEALISLSQSTTGQITKHAHIGSSKVYEVLARLQNKGLASFVIKNGVKHYAATPPERLIDFLEDKKESLSNAQEKVKNIIPALKKLGQEKQENTTVIYTGKKGPVIALKEVLETAKKGVEVVGFGTDEDDYLKLFPSVLHQYIKDAKKYTIKERLLFRKGFQSPNVNANIRYLPSEYMLPVRTMIYGDKVAIVDFSVPMTTIIIHKQEIAETYLKHFNLLWKIAKT